MHPRGLALLSLVAASACGRLSFDPAVSGDAARDGVPPGVDAFDVTACHNTPGLVAYWPFDETTGTVAADYSMNQQDGDLIGSIAFAPGRIGGALASSGGTVKLRNTSGLAFGGGTGSFTISYWLQPQSLTNATYIRPLELAYCGGSAYLIVEIQQDGTVLLGGYDFANNYTQTNSPPGSLQIGRWTHIAHAIDRAANTGQTFIDGVAGNVDDMSAWTGTISCTDPMIAANLGGWGAFPYLGGMDDVRVYDRVLSQPEVQQLATMTTTRCP